MRIFLFCIISLVVAINVIGFFEVWRVNRVLAEKIVLAALSFAGTFVSLMIAFGGWGYDDTTFKVLMVGSVVVLTVALDALVCTDMLYYLRSRGDKDKYGHR